MALKVSPNPPAKISGRQFVEYLITKGRLKVGFRSVLKSYDLHQIDQYLVAKNLVEKKELPELYADYYGLPFVSLVDKPLRREIVSLIPREAAEKYQVIAYDLQGKDIFIAIGRPSMLQSSAPGALLRLRQQKGLDIHLAIAPANQIQEVIGQAYQTINSNQAVEPVKTTEPSAKPEPPVVQPPSPPPSPIEQKPALSETINTRPVRSLNKEDLLKEVDPRQKTVDLTGLKIPHEVLAKIPYAVARKYQLVVFGSNMDRGQYEPPLIQIGVVNPNDIHTKEILAYIEQKNKILVDHYVITPESLEAALKQYPRPGESPTSSATIAPEAKPSPTPSSPAPVVEPVQQAELPPPAVPVPVEGVILTEGQIVNRPSDEADPKELSSLTKTEEPGFDEQNLDLLLKEPIASPEVLAEVIKRGIIPEIVAATLFLGIRMKASDVHIEAQKAAVRFRFRIDGILHDIISVPSFMHAPLISRIKILSKMKIDEQRVPQDGRFDVIIDKRQVDMRVSTLPTVFGEKIVMRLLDKSVSIMSLEQLGVTEANFDTLVANISKPYGIILSTGPTGSGKTTTLYAILNRISKPGINIITLEDPVEYELPGVNQSQVKPQIGFTFADGLRSVLRQDPNVIMVGEVRDLETAAMATHAALTGHLVLSTLHTNDAAGALPRMINMGVEPFLITSSINAVVGQRLVRKVCDKCREKAEIPPAVKDYIKRELAQVPSGQLKGLSLEQLVFYRGRGCPDCSNGYSGRIGIFEVLAMTEEIEELAVRKEPSSEIKKAAIKGGMVTMVQDGLIKALKGITTVDEVMRVTTASIKDAPQE